MKHRNTIARWSMLILLSVALGVMGCQAGAARPTAAAPPSPPLNTEKPSEIAIAAVVDDAETRVIWRWTERDPTAAELGGYLAELDDEARRDCVRTLAEQQEPLAPAAARAMVKLAPEAAAWDEVDRAAAALALGRAMDQAALKQVVTALLDERTPTEQRTFFAMALGHYRDRQAAEALVTVADSPAPDELRLAAMASLRRIAADDRPGDDPILWRTWFEQHAALAEGDWLRQLVNEIAARQRELTAAMQQSHQQALTTAQADAAAARTALRETAAALTDSRRRLYVLLPEDQQDRALIQWLADPLEAGRLLALELVDQRQQPGQAPGEALVFEVRKRMEDASPEVRRRALEVLWKVGDAAAADAAAARLVQGQETSPTVVRAALLLLERLPRAAAVPVIVSYLEREDLRTRASGALASAIDAQLLTPDQLTQLGLMVRTLLPADRLPAPETVTLLSRVAEEQDWQRIAAWLDAPDDGLVKEAAARAWARSGRPLLILAERADDQHIRQIAIDEIRQRGEHPATMLALIAHRPADERLAADWRRALAAMATRVPVPALLDAEQALRAQPDSVELRRALLATGITRIAPDPPQAGNGGPTPLHLSDDDARILADLLLCRAELAVSAGDLDAATADLDRINRMSVAFDAPRQRRLNLALLAPRLATADVDGAVALAKAALEGLPDEDTSALVTTRCLDAAQRWTAAGQRDRAANLLQRLTLVLGDQAPPDWAKRIEAATTVVPATEAPRPPATPAPTGEVNVAAPVVPAVNPAP